MHLVLDSTSQRKAFFVLLRMSCVADQAAAVFIRGFQDRFALATLAQTGWRSDLVLDRTAR